MKNKYFILAVLLLASLFLGACTRSATSQEEAAVTQNPIESIFSTVATQTALAASGAKSGDDSSGAGSGDDGPAVTNTPTEAPTSTPEPTPTNTAAPTTDPGPAPLTYTLREGEWPYCLARRFDVNPEALIAVNGLEDASELSVGTVITIPTNQGPFGGQRALRSHPTSYTASGIDTFYSIACEFGDLYPESIAEANGKDVDYVPAAGEVLQIPNPLNYRTEKSETLHRGRVFDLLRDQVRYPDGRLATFEVLRYGDAVAILPQAENSDLLFVRQYRHAIGDMVLEIPAGRLEPGENPLQCAQRELKEEVGMAAQSWRELGSFLVAPGYSDEHIHLFFARDLRPQSLPQDDDEQIEIVRLSPAKARAHLQSGLIRDAKSALALHLLKTPD